MNAVHTRAVSRIAVLPVLEWLASTMRIIDRYICRAIVSHAVLGLAVFTFVFFVPQMARIMELVARHSGSFKVIGTLLLSTLPQVLTFTIPIGLLVGILIGLGGLSADSEIIAMSASGMGLRRLLVPVGAVSLLAAALTACLTIWLSPMSVKSARTAAELLRTSQASLQIQPRVFDERFPHLVLYVQDVSAAATHWSGIFLVQSDSNDVSRLTVAKEAIVIADQQQGKLDLHLGEGSMHESSANGGNYSLSEFGQRDLSVSISDLTTARTLPAVNAERSLSSLLAIKSSDPRGAAMEFHRRLAFPAACFAFAIMGVPLVARPRRGSRSAGFLVALLLICSYYVIFTAGAGLARDGLLPPWLGIWAANIVITAAGLLLMPGVNRMPDGRGFARFFRGASAAGVNQQTSESEAPSVSTAHKAATSKARRLRPLGGFPQLIDFYLLRNFVFYFGMLLVGFLVLFEAFNFFELVDDLAQHRTPLPDVLNFFLYLAVFLFYQIAPLACVVAVLVTLGVMAKNNELIAFKAAGVSLYRLALPLVTAGVLLAVGLVMLDNSYLPYASQRQDALRNQIQGRPAQTFYQPEKSWILGDDSRVYNYQLFDPDHSLFGRLSIFELDPKTFGLRRRIYADRADWLPQERAWVLSSGWVRTFSPRGGVTYASFSQQKFPELHEPPTYFNREVRQAFQMNWRELRRYIGQLQRAGFDVTRLSVQLHRKLAFPLIAPIVMLLALPFSLHVGSRGAVGGLSIGVGLAVVYWAASALLEALGAVGQLPPVLAAWAPDAAFFFVALYFFLRMPT